MAKRIKGMYDILPPESSLWQEVERVFIETASSYGFSLVRTPILERTELFSRSIGETTDIVEKEMYTFPDRRGRKLSLRPEGTASMVRAYIENKVASVDPVAKWFYIGPMYRYERPQKGRNRQFFQLGAEVFGLDAAEQDAELIALGWRYFERLGLQDVSLELNSLGDPEERKTYRKTLLEFLGGQRESLCEDCRRRIDTNPLRVLDCKVPTCAEITKDAPKMLDHLGGETKAHFDRVCELLTDLGIPFTINRSIVRGLDYYNRTCFEFKTDKLGAQDALGGGGRYDALVKELGGPKTPAVGFALGIDRIVLLLSESEIAQSKLDFYVVPMGEKAQKVGLQIATKLRNQGAIGEVDLSGRRLKHLFARAERRGARYAIILGDDEINRGVVNLKDLEGKDQTEITIDELCADTLR